MIRRDWKHLKYQLAEKLFCAEMDEAFNMGVGHGVTLSTRMMSFALRNMDVSELTKTQRIGHERAVETMVATTKKIHIESGVM